MKTSDWCVDASCRLWTRSAAASRARMYPARENVQVSGKEHEAAFRGNMRESSRKSARDTSSSKMSAGCSPEALKSSCVSWSASGMMRNGKCSPLPRLAPRTIGKGYSLLPTPTVCGLTHHLACLLRSDESWETTSNLLACLIGSEYGLTGRQKRPSGKYMADVSFAEWMMGVPRGWTESQ